MLKIKQFTFNPFGENTYLVVDDATRKAAVIDPGMSDKSEQRVFDDFVREHKIIVDQLINTHMHLDHCFGDNYVRTKYGVKVQAHIGDAQLAKELAIQGARFGMAQKADPVDIEVPLKEGDVIKIGQSELHVIHVPGHSPGGIALYSPEDHFVLAGDSLFKGSIGRTDLPGGNHHQLIDNVNKKLLTLPENTVVLSGHGPYTTVGAEKATNPFLT